MAAVTKTQQNTSSSSDPRLLQSWLDLCFDLQPAITHHFANEILHRLLDIVHGLDRHVIVLQILAARVGELVIGNVRNLAQINHVANDHDRNIACAHLGEVLVIRSHIHEGDARRDIKHDDGRVTTNVVAMTDPAKLILTANVPELDDNRTARRAKGERRNVRAHGCWRK